MNRYAGLIALAFAAGMLSSVSAAPYTEIVAFGDSTTDMGNSAPIPQGMPLPTVYGLAPWIQ